jgi:hypothetical protein
MKKFLVVLFLAFTLFFLFYMGLPVLKFGFYKLPFLMILWTFIAMLFFFKAKSTNNGQNIKVIQAPHKAWWIVIFVMFFYATIVAFFTSGTVLHTKSYQTLIGNVQSGNEITDHIDPIAIEQLRVVDRQLAYLLGEKILGSQPALGSQVELGDFSIQQVNGKLYWVSPLLYSGFFKWFNNPEGTPGYVMVSATNERDVKLVQQIDGKPIRVKYQPNAYFQSEIHRHVYLNGYATVGLDDFTFELDDTGKPFWVITKYDKQIGFSGSEAMGVVVVDAETGAILEYSIDETPAWVDRIQPGNFIEDQLNDWGKYVHGYWNFSNLEKLQITEGLTLVYGKDNKSYWYTGITSVGKEESCVGFMLIDTRTKETIFYKQSGATEYAAQSSAEGKVQEKGYRASMPIPYNINNIPTYVMTLKDDGGLVKMYAMVAVSDYTIVGVGNTMRETLTAFKSAFNMNGNSINPKGNSDRKSLKSVVQRIQNDVKNGNSFYYFTVKDHPKIFVGSSQISSQLPITNVGDSIMISFDVDLEEMIDVSSFKNISLKSEKAVK